jgi:hypothetical protein
VKKPLTLAFILGMASCAAPKAVVVGEAPVKPKENAVAAAPEPRVPTDANDGLRLPADMLALPDDSQLRSASNPSGDGDATVITRPPKE